jgi:lipoprotein NlpD
MTRLLPALMLLAMTGCTARGPAPVSERPAARTPSPAPVKPAPATVPAPAPAAALAPVPAAARPPAQQVAPSGNASHTVQRGETLYAIAFANNLDYREVATWNQLDSHDLIRVGQVLRLTPPPGTIEVKPLPAGPAPRPQPLVEPPLLRGPQAVLLAYSEANWTQVSGAATAPPSAAPALAAERSAAQPAAAPPAAVPPNPPPEVPATVVDSWLWPADGTLAGRFGGTGGKGIDIVGPRNSPVRAVAPGKVVYSGTGLRGYGRLLIVKHPGEFLSAYAHNESVLVKEGDSVKAGQTIAQMGDSDADRVKLHFEIRRYGKPLDPLDYLPERS